ncbi:MAG: hypothetical protein MAG581_02789 [Deltaproteobacteria bacterium]|nr:hypothetical protein [Deltaproteobacteria bacterium]
MIHLPLPPHSNPLPWGEGGPRCLSEVEGAVGEVRESKVYQSYSELL